MGNVGPGATVAQGQNISIKGINAEEMRELIVAARNKDAYEHIAEISRRLGQTQGEMRRMLANLGQVDVSDERLVETLQKQVDQALKAAATPERKSELPSIWQALMNTVIGAAAESVARQQRTAAETVNIAGQWRDPYGAVFQFRQQGARVSVLGAVSGYELSGSGWVERQSVEIEGFCPPYGTVPGVPRGIG
jgi:hypothetical protein